MIGAVEHKLPILPGCPEENFLASESLCLIEENGFSFQILLRSHSLEMGGSTLLSMAKFAFQPISHSLCQCHSHMHYLELLDKACRTH
jgi:hypothetical protein